MIQDGKGLTDATGLHCAIPEQPVSRSPCSALRGTLPSADYFNDYQKDIKKQWRAGVYPGRVIA